MGFRRLANHQRDGHRQECRVTFTLCLNFPKFLLIKIFSSLLALLSVGGLAPVGHAEPPPDPERQLIQAMARMEGGELDAAIHDLEQLTRRVPHFHLAQAIKGDLLLAKARALSDFGDGLRNDGERAGLIAEVQARFQARLLQPERTRLPASILQISKRTGTVILVEKSRNRLFVYQAGDDGLPTLTHSRYSSYGRRRGDKRLEGDLKTPEGVYFIVAHLADDQLAEKYGAGAYVLNYPNELDQRQGKTGHGIWIHGLERNRYSRPPLDSEGCVVIANEHLNALAELVTIGRTAVIIGERIEWLSPQQWRARRDALSHAVERWRADWASLNVETYLTRYHADFWAPGHDLSRWRQRKRRLATRKTFQRVAVSDLDLLAYPPDAGDGKGPIAVALFDQRYESNNYSSTDRKKLFFRRQGSDWLIGYEAAL